MTSSSSTQSSMTPGPLAQPLLGAETRVADAIVAALADAGVEFVLGIPGGITGPIWRALHEHPTIRAVLVREESLGSYMAEAMGRLSGRPAVVMGQGEWIAANAGQGYLESLMGSSPLVILTEMSDGAALSHHGVYQSGTGDYGNWDARKVLEGMTKRVMVSHYPSQAVQHVQLAIKHAVTGDPGPVAVILTSSSLSGSVDPDAAPRLHRSSGYLPAARPGPSGDDVEAVREAVTSARRPVLVAGNGIRVGQAGTELQVAAETFELPVVTTAQGKGVFDETHPLAGGVIGAFGWPSANDLVATADVVLAVGTKLGTVDTIDENVALLDPRRQRILHVDVEPLVLGWTTPVERAVLSDAAGFLRALCAGDPPRPGGSDGRDRVAAARQGDVETAGDPGSAPFEPQRVIGLLRQQLPPDAIVTADAGENRLFMMRWFQSRRPGDYLQPASGGGMGHAVPSALGAKLLRPDAPVVAVCGDGGFAMSIHGLMTAIEQELPIGVVILNNQALGWVLHGMGDKVVAAKFAPFDHAAIARSIGCDGVRPTDHGALVEALARLGDLRRPMVIDVPTGLETTFRDLLDPIDQRRGATGY